MKIIRIPAGIYGANCYLIYSDSTKDGIIVDPGGDADGIIKYIERENLNIEKIILTHGHADHIGGVIELKEALNAKVMIHKDDVELLKDGSKNLSTTMAMGSIEIEPDIVLNDGDLIKFGELQAKVIHTPGHTKGGICLEIGDKLITGDSLFAGSVGRTDLLGGNHNALIKSIKEKLLIYPDEVEVLPGHGGSSTIGIEKKANPFLK